MLEVCHYRNNLGPGEAHIFRTGKVWFTLEARCRDADGRNDFSSLALVKDVANVAANGAIVGVQVAGHNAAHGTLAVMDVVFPPTLAAHIGLIATEVAEGVKAAAEAVGFVKDRLLKGGLPTEAAQNGVFARKSPVF